MTDQSTQPHPKWKPVDGSPRHPQRVEEWDWRQDFASVALDRSIRRLNVACDYDDPRASDQMALVLRVDLSRALGDLTHKRAAFETLSTCADFRDVLKQHWLTGIKCDEVARTDTATCFCTVWTSGPKPTVAEAVNSWIEHVLESV